MGELPAAVEQLSVLCPNAHASPQRHQKNKELFHIIYFISAICLQKYENSFIV
jgi:hypothetical protein